MFIPKNVEFILDKLNTETSSAYVVGGCVRDDLLGRPPSDYDICTSLKPEEVKEVFKDYRIIETGIEHGTVTVVIDDKQYEITTYRVDGEYSDNRHPDSVEFTDDIVADLSRRDFTMNAIAYNRQTGYVDPFYGRDDIDNKIIRCVGSPTDRFYEDALRMLRAERFSIVYGFEIEADTMDAIIHNAHLLKNIAMERINTEFAKALNSGNPISCGMLKLLQVVVPEYLTKDVIGECMCTLDSVKSAGSVTMAFIMQIMYEHKVRAFMDIEGFMLDLKFSKNSTKYVKSLFQWFNRCKKMMENGYTTGLIDPAIVQAKYILRDCPYDTIMDLHKLSDVYTIHQHNKAYMLNKYISLISDVANEANKECHSLAQLSINGNDLTNIGYKGRDIGEMLNYILDLVITGRIKNEHDDLVAYANLYFQKYHENNLS